MLWHHIQSNWITGMPREANNYFAKIVSLQFRILTSSIFIQIAWSLLQFVPCIASITLIKTKMMQLCIVSNFWFQICFYALCIMYEGMSLWVWMQWLVIKYNHAWPNIPNFLRTKSCCCMQWPNMYRCHISHNQIYHRKFTDRKYSLTIIS